MINRKKYLEEAAERRAKIYQMHLDNPAMSQKAIGEKFGGVKKQRIDQIIKRVAKEQAALPESERMKKAG